jgi:ATP-dependent helicase HrpB
LSEGDFVRRERDDLPVDLEWRLQLLDAPRQGVPIQHGVAQRIQQLSRQLLQRSSAKNDRGTAAATDAAGPMLGALLLAAFPDRVARQRQTGSNRYLGIDGFEFILDQNDALCSARWLVIAEHDGARQGAHIRLAAALDETEVHTLLARRVLDSEELRWDEASQRLSAKRLRRLGAITLDEQMLPIDDERANIIWLRELRARGCAWLQWSEAVETWLARVRWLQRKTGTGPDFSEAELLATLEAWLLPYLSGIRRKESLCALDFVAILRAQLDYAQQQQLAQLAPERLQLPSGATHPIDYRGDGPPRLAARLTEFYGLNLHPTIAGEALLLELLSPAYRPVQMTQDLPGFWRSSYPEVRKEMKGRYPKHFWPEQPWSAPATTTTKKRMPIAPQ